MNSSAGWYLDYQQQFPHEHDPLWTVRNKLDSVNPLVEVLARNIANGLLLVFDFKDPFVKIDPPARRIELTWRMDNPYFRFTILVLSDDRVYIEFVPPYLGTFHRRQKFCNCHDQQMNATLFDMACRVKYYYSKRDEIPEDSKFGRRQQDDARGISRLKERVLSQKLAVDKKTFITTLSR